MRTEHSEKSTTTPTSLLSNGPKLEGCQSKKIIEPARRTRNIEYTPTTHRASLRWPIRYIQVHRFWHIPHKRHGMGNNNTGITIPVEEKRGCLEEGNRRRSKWRWLFKYRVHGCSSDDVSRTCNPNLKSFKVKSRRHLPAEPSSCRVSPWFLQKYSCC